MPLTLRCLIVGEEGSFKVESESNVTVATFKKTIKSCKPSKIQCPAEAIVLYLATVESDDGVKWIPFDEAMAKLTKDTVTTQVQQCYLQPQMVLHDQTLLAQYFPSQPLMERKIHLLVQLPYHAKPISVTRQKLFRVKVLQTNGIDYSLRNYIERVGLATRLWNMLGASQIVVLASPTATGKTSLIQLTEQRFQFKCRTFDCKMGDDPFALLLSAGIDLIHQKLLISEHKMYVIALDNAHNVFGVKSFWTRLVQDSAKWLPPNYKFIVSAKHVLTHMNRAPIELANLPRLYRSDFLLSDEEVNQVIAKSWLGDIQWIQRCKCLRAIISQEAGGIIGVVRCFIAKLYFRCHQRHGLVSELDLVHYCFTDSFLRSMHPVFSISVCRAPVELRQFLRNCYLSATREPAFQQDESQHALLDLVEEGVLVESSAPQHFRFGCLLAERFYFKDVFSCY